MACVNPVIPTVSLWTHISAEAPFVKLWGIVDPDKLASVQDTIRKHAPALKEGYGQILSAKELSIGQVVLAFRDDHFQRAKIVARSKSLQKIYVRFIDIGLYISVTIKKIRVVDDILSAIPYNGLAEEFILNGVVTRRFWTKNESVSVNSHYLPYLTKITLIDVVVEKKIIQISIVMPNQYKRNLSDFLIAGGYGDKISNKDDFVSILHSTSTVSNESNAQIPNTSGSLPIPMSVQNLCSTSTVSNESHVQTPNPSKSLPIPMKVQNSSAAPVNSDDTSLLSLISKYQEIKISEPIQSLPPVHSIHSFVYLSLTINSTYDVDISHVTDGMNSFAVQLKETTSATLNTVVKKIINNIQLVPVPGKIGPGTLCLGRFAKDKSLRRAVVSNVTIDGVCLYFVDYGNTEVVPVKEIYKIPPELLQIPALAYQFTLANLTKNDALKTEESHQLFTLLVQRKGLSFKLKVVEPLVPTNQYCELFIDADGKTINIQDFIIPVEFKKITLNQCQTIDVCISCFGFPLRFYVQLELNKEILDMISKCIEDYCKNSVTKDILCQEIIVKNMAVCAPYKDEKYYRGLVMDVPDGKGNVTVLFVDYGDFDTIHYSKLRIMSNDILSQFPLQAIECYLEIDATLADSKNVYNKFHTLMDDGCCKCKMVVKSNLPDHAVLVDLIHKNGFSVATHLKEIFGA